MYVGMCIMRVLKIHSKLKSLVNRWFVSIFTSAVYAKPFKIRGSQVNPVNRAGFSSKSPKKDAKSQG
jgi:hypothetical protein